MEVAHALKQRTVCANQKSSSIPYVPHKSHQCNQQRDDAELDRHPTGDDDKYFRVANEKKGAPHNLLCTCPSRIYQQETREIACLLSVSSALCWPSGELASPGPDRTNSEDPKRCVAKVMVVTRVS